MYGGKLHKAPLKSDIQVCCSLLAMGLADTNTQAVVDVGTGTGEH